MATNVYLVFFHGFNSQQLHGLEKYYFLLAYGIPAIPAISYVVLDHTGHRVIGPASVRNFQFGSNQRLTNCLAMVLGCN